MTLKGSRLPALKGSRGRANYGRNREAGRGCPGAASEIGKEVRDRLIKLKLFAVVEPTGLRAHAAPVGLRRTLATSFSLQRVLATSVGLPLLLAAAFSLQLVLAPPVVGQPAGGQEGRAVFEEACLECHAQGNDRAPGRGLLSMLSARAVVSALEDGVMRAEGATLTPAQRVAVAEYVTGKSVENALLPESVYCEESGAAPDPSAVDWMGFAGNLEGTGYRDPQQAGLDAREVSGLELRWAFAFPGSAQARTSPTVAGDVALVGGPLGEVLALDVRSGCVRWAFAADAPVRGAVLLGTRAGEDGPAAGDAPFRTVAGNRPLRTEGRRPVPASGGAPGDPERQFSKFHNPGTRPGNPETRPDPPDNADLPTAYFVDHRTNAYALDASSGELLWKVRVGWHASSNTTGSPALHDGRLYVPISSLEVVVSGDPRYECCTASGAVAALAASDGEIIWYHRVIPEYPEEVGENELGTTLWAPSGAPVWSSPTIDTARGLVYVGTGENYTHPTTANSDAVLAIDAETGELAWSFQATAGDAFTMACTTRFRQNCPDPVGPDHDFGMAPMIVTRVVDGRNLLIAGQKSGMVWALDPDNNGEVVWSIRVGKGGSLGGVHWGMASDGYQAYATVSDRGAVIVDSAPEHDPSPGLYAINLQSGELAWRAELANDVCEGRRACFRALSAAPTAIAGAVFAGGLDGRMRAFNSVTGALLWEYDTLRDYEAVGGVAGRGGAIDGPGPVVAGGHVFVNSGYGNFGQMAGNVLLAFGPTEALRGDGGTR